VGSHMSDKGVIAGISGCCLLILAWYALCVFALVWSILDYTSGAKQHVPIDIAIWVVVGLSVLGGGGGSRAH
jgi:hypothetical protein